MAKKGVDVKIHTSFWPHLGISGGQIVSQQVSHLFTTGVNTKQQGGDAKNWLTTVNQFCC